MNPRRRRIKRRLAYEHRILIRTFAVGLPGVLAAMLLLWIGDYTPKLKWTVTVIVLCAWWALAAALQQRVIHPLQLLSNMLAALREGDFTIRARGARRDDARGDVMWEINALTRTLREQRLDALEATTLLRKIMEEIDVAIFAFDADHRLRLVNRAGERLLARPAERVIGRDAEVLGLSECLADRAPAVLDRTFPGSTGRWEVRRSDFRQGGLPLRLLVLSDVSRALREEERQAWQRLIRVLSHEMNNSLTPIRSIAGSLEQLLERRPRPPDWEADLGSGLEVISARSESLVRFMEAYARLARLPAPSLAPVDLGALVRRVAELETRMTVEVEPGSTCTIEADADQVEQLLINLVRNAVDATIDTGGSVRVGWQELASTVEVWIVDDGPGLPNTSNLFVPFFSTKPGGSGIGLVLSRQIAEAHGGRLVVQNQSGKGCEARLSLPRGGARGDTRRDDAS